MFDTNWAFSKSLKKKINKAMENHIIKTLQSDGNFLKPEYTSEINISYINKNKLSIEESDVLKLTFK